MDSFASGKELAGERMPKAPQNTEHTEKQETVKYSYDCQGNTLTEETWSGAVANLDSAESMIPVKRVSYAYNEFNRSVKALIDEARCELGSKAVETKSSLENVYTQENFYDAENFRYGIMENEKRTDFISNGWDVYAEQDDKGQIVNRLVRGYGIVAAEFPTGTDGSLSGRYGYYHMDEHGDVGYITDEHGVVKNRYAYDAFGSTVRADEVIRNRY